MIVLSIKYPKGATLFPSSSYSYQKKKKKQEIIAKESFSNRGMQLEHAINESNHYYLTHNIAVIYKKPTPLRIVKVDYPKRSAAVVKEAYFSQASTTDYNGVYKGYYLDFEAKETKNQTSFPLQNFHTHQINHFKYCLHQKGICFAILYFSRLKRCFVLPAKALIYYFDQQQTKRKSIPLKEIEKIAYELPIQYAPQIPYLKAIDIMIEKEKFTRE